MWGWSEEWPLADSGGPDSMETDIPASQGVTDHGGAQTQYQHPGDKPPCFKSVHELLVAGHTLSLGVLWKAGFRFSWRSSRNQPACVTLGCEPDAVTGVPPKH